MSTSATALELRLQRWHQTAATKIAGIDDAARLIAEAHLVSHYRASPEIPNLYDAYMGEPDAKTDNKWDSPSGHVYTWRWELGGRDAGFYVPLVRKRPTWVSWDLLPAMLRLRGDLRAPDELFDLGVISARAYQIVQALEEGGGVMSTSELRRAADFPTGKEQRAAFGKAIDELDSRLLLGKVFPLGTGDEGERMQHALVPVHFRRYAEAADRTTAAEAFDTLLSAYLPLAIFIAPAVFAKHVGVEEQGLRDALERLRTASRVEPVPVPGYRGECLQLAVG